MRVGGVNGKRPSSRLLSRYGAVCFAGALCLELCASRAGICVRESACEFVYAYLRVCVSLCVPVSWCLYSEGKVCACVRVFVPLCVPLELASG